MALKRYRSKRNTQESQQMNHSKKMINYQQKKVVKKIKMGGINSFHNLLAEDSIQEEIQKYQPNYRNRIYTP